MAFMKQKSISFLSVEIRDEIFSFCSYKELQNIAGTCRGLRKEINDHARRRSKKEYNQTVQLIRHTKPRIPRDWITCYVKFVRTLCLDCGTTSVGRKNRSAPVLCDFCRQNRNPVITKIDAKTKYVLNESDLQRLECTKVDNTHYCPAPPICLYNLREVQEAALQKHGGENGLTEALLVVQQRKDALHIAHVNAQNVRRQNLMTLLAAVSVPFSLNSETCKRYIKGGRIKMKDIVTGAKRDHIISVHTDFQPRDSYYSWDRARNHDDLVRFSSAYYVAQLSDMESTPCIVCGEPLFASLTTPNKPRFGMSFALPVKAQHAHEGMTERAKKVAQNRDGVSAEIYQRQIAVDKFLNAHVKSDEKLQGLREHPKIVSYIDEGNVTWSIFLGFLKNFIK